MQVTRFGNSESKQSWQPPLRGISNPEGIHNLASWLNTEGKIQPKDEFTGSIKLPDLRPPTLKILEQMQNDTKAIMEKWKNQVEQKMNAEE
ncbi:MAG: hypothetical protein VKJ06_02090 [Vampirovibrionales bacterium]|nr:hypothetical protein [Vampirovibrionales bacterium]